MIRELGKVVWERVEFIGKKSGAWMSKECHSARAYMSKEEVQQLLGSASCVYACGMRCTSQGKRPVFIT